MVHGSRKFFASGSWLANVNLLLPCWAITAIATTELLRTLGLIIIQSVSHLAFSAADRMALVGALIIQLAGLIWYAHRHGMEPRAIDPRHLHQYYIGHGLIALTTLTVVGLAAIPPAWQALGHAVDIDKWEWYLFFSFLFAVFTYPTGAGLIWKAK
jgi:hypothetical protein